MSESWFEIPTQERAWVTKQLPPRTWWITVVVPDDEMDSDENDDFVLNPLDMDVLVWMLMLMWM